MTDHTLEMVVHEGITSCPFIPFSQWADNEPPAWAVEAARSWGKGPAAQKANAAKVLTNYAENSAWTVYTGQGEADASLWIHPRLPARLAWPILEGGKSIYRNEPKTPLLERMRGTEMLTVDHPLYAYESVRDELDAILSECDYQKIREEWLAPAASMFQGLTASAQDDKTTDKEFIRLLEKACDDIPNLELNTEAVAEPLAEASMKGFQLGVNHRKHLTSCALLVKDDFLAALHGTAKNVSHIRKLDGKVKREIRNEGPDTALGLLATQIEDLATNEKRPPTKKELRDAYNDEAGREHGDSWIAPKLKALRMEWLPRQPQNS